MNRYTHIKIHLSGAIKNQPKETRAGAIAPPDPPLTRSLSRRNIFLNFAPIATAYRYSARNLLGTRVPHQTSIYQARALSTKLDEIECG